MSIKRKTSRRFFDHFVSLLGGLVIVFFIRSSFIESFKIPSGSMIPTILIGDHVFVNKMAYRLNLPFSEYFGEPITLMKREGPRRGDVVVLRYPRDESVNYIKRVIGIPGDIIQIRNRQLKISGRDVETFPAEEERAKKVFEELHDPKLSVEDVDLYVENLEGEKHLVFRDKNNFLTENYGPITVPENQYFVMGDNRDFSNDSRFWGFVRAEKIKGRALFVWLSVWMGFDPPEFNFRPLRTGKSI